MQIYWLLRTMSSDVRAKGDKTVESLLDAIKQAAIAPKIATLSQQQHATAGAGAAQADMPSAPRLRALRQHTSNIVIPSSGPLAGLSQYTDSQEASADGARITISSVTAPNTESTRSDTGAPPFAASAAAPAAEPPQSVAGSAGNQAQRLVEMHNELGSGEGVTQLVRASMTDLQHGGTGVVPMSVPLEAAEAAGAAECFKATVEFFDRLCASAATLVPIAPPRRQSTLRTRLERINERLHAPDLVGKVRVCSAVARIVHVQHALGTGCSAVFGPGPIIIIIIMKKEASMHRGQASRCITITSVLQVLWPMGECNQIILRLVPNRAAILNSRERAPFVLFVETMELPDSSSEGSDPPQPADAVTSAALASAADAIEQTPAEQSAPEDTSKLPPDFFRSVALASQQLAGSHELPAELPAEVAELAAQAPPQPPPARHPSAKLADAAVAPADSADEASCPSPPEGTADAQAAGADGSPSAAAVLETAQAAAADAQALQASAFDNCEPSQEVATDTTMTAGGDASPVTARSGSSEHGCQRAPAEQPPALQAALATEPDDGGNTAALSADAAERPTAQGADSSPDAGSPTAGAHRRASAGIAEAAPGADAASAAHLSGALSVSSPLHRVPSEEGLRQMISSMHGAKLAEPRGRGLHMEVNAADMTEAASLTASTATPRPDTSNAAERPLAPQATAASDAALSAQADDGAVTETAAQALQVERACEHAQQRAARHGRGLSADRVDKSARPASEAARTRSRSEQHLASAHGAAAPAQQGAPAQGAAHPPSSKAQSETVRSRTSIAGSSGSWVQVDEEHSHTGTQQSSGNTSTERPGGELQPTVNPPAPGDGVPLGRVHGTVGGLRRGEQGPRSLAQKRREHLSLAEIEHMSQADYAQHVHGAQLLDVTASIRSISPYGRCAPRGWLVRLQGHFSEVQKHALSNYHHSRADTRTMHHSLACNHAVASEHVSVATNG